MFPLSLDNTDRCSTCPDNTVGSLRRLRRQRLPMCQQHRFPLRQRHRSPLRQRHRSPLRQRHRRLRYQRRSNLRPRHGHPCRRWRSLPRCYPNLRNQRRRLHHRCPSSALHSHTRGRAIRNKLEESRSGPFAASTLHLRRVSESTGGEVSRSSVSHALSALALKRQPRPGWSHTSAVHLRQVAARVPAALATAPRGGWPKARASRRRPSLWASSQLPDWQWCTRARPLPGSTSWQSP